MEPHMWTTESVALLLAHLHLNTPKDLNWASTAEKVLSDSLPESVEKPTAADIEAKVTSLNKGHPWTGKPNPEEDCGLGVDLEGPGVRPLTREQEIAFDKAQEQLLGATKDVSEDVVEKLRTHDSKSEERLSGRVAEETDGASNHEPRMGDKANTGKGKEKVHPQSNFKSGSSSSSSSSSSSITTSEALRQVHTIVRHLDNKIAHLRVGSGELKNLIDSLHLDLVRMEIRLHTRIEGAVQEIHEGIQETMQSTSPPRQPSQSYIILLVFLFLLLQKIIDLQWGIQHGSSAQQ
ncbi:hypothetical protein DM02DRAFT_624472 [Periconia macrospinosa]|uniref:Uncharacterized protein n=1 Tax=Periconia macrospinosa TaxID=97972 RepID=A0A2V1E325_9PLEO|nr:hypothetical protein DM02DRAFT_624472 [Periconia macrospinosa]